VKSLRPAWLWLAGCSTLFVGVYNACNWITTRRADVGTWVFPWELQIPFLPWMIVPYWSLDLFFVGSFFLCRSSRELEVLGRRVALAILAAGACFLVLPLRAVFPRPPAAGVYGLLFGLLRSFDQPHNLFPSLHIAFCVLFAEHYARYWRRWAVYGWFSLVGISTLFTYQHHVMDLVGGCLLAAVCLHAYRCSWTPTPRARNRAVGFRYAAAAGLLALTAGSTRPWGMLLLWPAVGLGWVAAGYLGLGASIYRKEAGRLPWSTQVLMAPVLLGHWLSYRYYRRQCRPWDEVAPGVLVGRRLSNPEARGAIEAGVSAVLDLTAESSEAGPFLDLPYLNLPVLDLTAPSQEQLRTGVAFLLQHAPRGKVYVHCKIGYSRSAALAAAHLLANKLGRNPEDAFERLLRVRPSMVIRSEIRSSLLEFQAQR
jgi:membrane-associated phospholipid phosphatase